MLYQEGAARKFCKFQGMHSSLSEANDVNCSDHVELYVRRWKSPNIYTINSVREIIIVGMSQKIHGCGSPEVKVSDHGRHVNSLSPVPLKTRRKLHRPFAEEKCKSGSSFVDLQMIIPHVRLPRNLFRRHRSKSITGVTAPLTPTPS
ncbi:hypothetical protein TNCV_2411251 [Trichonephila clavipes]|nr:hypothetical protein TNCV_2411251 [Trichonephila clavipes]